MTNHQTTIGEIAEIFDGPHATPKKIDAGPYFLSISSLINGRLELPKSAYISEEDFIKWTKRVRPQEEDLLFSYETRLGQAALMPSGIKACLGRRMGLLRPVRSKVLPQYLLYAYLSPNFQQVILRNTVTGATVDRIALSEMAGFPIRIPPLNEQKIVADLLQAIDSKIELNNKINAELEAMAKLIYDYWFVQFDFPDDNGKTYKSSGGKMVYNEELKREIPDGWSVETLSKNLNIYDSIRVPMSKKERETKKGIYPYFGATSIMDHVDDFLFDDDYILLAEDGSIMDDKGMPIFQFIWGKTWVNNHAHVLQAKSKEQNEFYFQSLKQIPVVLIKTGSIQLKINQVNLMNYKCISPPEELVNKYSEYSSDIRKKLVNNIEEKKKLTELRDWLLPMLMNGQVTIKDN
jgi:type I restriction enzyme S subunit